MHDVPRGLVRFPIAKRLVALARGAGFTLIESVAVAGMVSLVVIVCLGLIPSFKMSNRRANMELRGGAMAQSGLELLRTVAFDEIASTPILDLEDDGVTYKATISESDPISVGTPPKVLSKTVRVDVTWRWSDRDYRTFRETVVCRVVRS